MPIITRRLTRVPNSTRSAATVKIGADVTSTTLAATVVSASDEIQVAKCTARNAPDSTMRATCRRVSPRSSPGCRTIASGRRIAAAIAFR